MTTKAAAAVAQYRPALCLSDAMPGGNAGLIHMGRKLATGGEIGACGAPVWCWGSAFNPGYAVCEACIAAAGFDPRTPAGQGKLF